MALVVAETAFALVELDLGDSLESLARLVESQRVLFHRQIDQLQKLVVAQCKLTGVNPLAQEMAAGALSIRIGKRPRDLLNPKAIKYMQSIFSIKDTIGKKETREISALCGVTISQVREFFAGQRSRVRKLVRLSCENSTKSDAYKTSKADSSFNLDQPLPLSVVPPGNVASAFVIGQQKQVCDATGIIGTVKIEQQIIPSPVEILKVGEGHPLPLQEETAPGVDSVDKEFLDKIFNMMKKEQTFAGQVRLMEWILRVQNNAILNWFSNNGGASILATWLSQAADEEQTTVLLVILKVLYHLPLHKALPLHMSTIVPAVNRLRFYRPSDISNKARILLSRWSKVFIKGQALKRPHIASSKATLQKTIHNKRICGFLDDQLLQSNLDTPENILALTGEVEITRESESKQALKQLPATCADSSRKHDQGVTEARSKERRKVLLVEQLDHKAAGRSSHAVRKVASNHSRPMSADDIQKAKMRAMFIQHKYGKADPSSSRIKSQKIKVLKPATASLKKNLTTECKLPQPSHVVEEENIMPTVSTEDDLPNKIKTSISNPNSAPKQDCYGILSCKPILWRIPQEMSISSTWSVGTGQNSKEFDVQTQRNRRESETLYSCLQDIPPNPKEPWDIEMDFDDSLTPEIPTEQPSDAEVEEGTSCPNPEEVEASASLVAPEITTSAPSTSGAVPEPDLELLAVLLKNPDLVFALTSNQGQTLSNGEMIALLDMLKKNGVGLMALLNEMASQKENSSSNETKFGERELPASLPSPTPPSEVERISAWRSELPTFSSAPVSLPHFLGSRAAAPQQIAASLQHHPPVAVSPVTMFSTPLVRTVADNSMNQSAHSVSSLLTRLPPSPPHNPPYTLKLQQTKVFDVDLPSKHYPVTNTAFISSVHRQESFILTPPTVSGHPTLPTISHNVQRTESPTISRTAIAWPPAAAAPATNVERDLTPDHLMGRKNCAVDISTTSQRYLPSQSTYGALPNGSALLPSGQREDENGFNDRELHTWRSDDTVRRATEFSSGLGYNDESRRDGGSSKRPDDRSRQWGPVSRDRDRNRDRDRDGYGTGKRWRDYSHGRRR